jgi:hypothetical protein
VDGDHLAELWRAPAPHSLLSPLVASDVHKDADEPSFFRRLSSGDSCVGPRHLKKCVLNEVERIVHARRQSASETVQALGVVVEQCRQLLLRSSCQLCARGRPLAHSLLNGPHPGFVGPLTCTSTQIDLGGPRAHNGKRHQLPAHHLAETIL